MLVTTLSTLLLTTAPGPQDGEATPLTSEITAVTVYTSAASVQRSATPPAGGGAFVLPGLPGSIDLEGLRVRCDGAEVVAVELRPRVEARLPEARLMELRQREEALVAQLDELADRDAVQARLAKHLDALFLQEERAHAGELAADQADAEAWTARLAWLTERMTATRAARRELGWEVAGLQVELADVRERIGRSEAGSGARVSDVHVELVDTSGGPAALEVEYLLAGAGWEPVYDLRAPRDLSRVELVYRARVWQRTGEDWRDVEVMLSTAQPQRGAQGPEPTAVWLRLGSEDVRQSDGYFLGRSLQERRKAVDRLDKVAEFGDSDGGGPLGGLAWNVEVLEEGLTVRYRLPRAETIESSDEPSTVLVGRSNLAVAPEHVCVPALDTTVWLRGRTTNTSDWVLLPGRAAVYFGADFLGHANLPAVQRGEELTLHLGPDPGFAVERIPLEDTTDEAGLFGSRTTKIQSWRFKLKNNGAFSNAADGSVALVLHESIPRPTDERVEVEIERAEPAVREGGRWKTLREEKNVLTWVLRVPRGQTRTVELETAISYPEDLQLILP